MFVVYINLDTDTETDTESEDPNQFYYDLLLVFLVLAVIAGVAGLLIWKKPCCRKVENHIDELNLEVGLPACLLSR